MLRKHLDSLENQFLLARCFGEWHRLSHVHRNQGHVQGTQEELATLCSAFIDVVKDVAELGSTIEQVAKTKSRHDGASPSAGDGLLGDFTVTPTVEASELGYELPWLQHQCREWNRALSTLAATEESAERTSAPEEGV